MRSRFSLGLISLGIYLIVVQGAAGFDEAETKRTIIDQRLQALSTVYGVKFKIITEITKLDGMIWLAVNDRALFGIPATIGEGGRDLPARSVEEDRL